MRSESGIRKAKVNTLLELTVPRSFRRAVGSEPAIPRFQCHHLSHNAIPESRRLSSELQNAYLGTRLVGPCYTNLIT